MSIRDFNEQRGLTTLGNRNDFCYLCATSIPRSNEAEYQKSFKKLRGAEEGKKVVKIRRAGTETVICMDCIHKLAEENPKEEK